MIHSVKGLVQVSEYCTSQCAVIHVLKELVIQVDQDSGSGVLWAESWLLTTQWRVLFKVTVQVILHKSLQCVRSVPEIILGGGWAAGTFLSCRGGRVFCWQRFRGVGNLSWGSRCIWSIVGQGLIKALTCPEGRRALTPCVSWRWRGLKTNAAHSPEGSFWNSPYCDW